MFFDRNEEVEFHFKGYLPHMHQDGTMQSVTFRMADSLPQSVCKKLQEQRDKFTQKHPHPWDNETKMLYWKEFGPMQHRLMDKGYGSCLLKYPRFRQVLIDTIAFNDNINYVIDSYVIMPNHVHMLILPLANNKIEDILHSIKRYSARQINLLAGRTGRFWMKESFDRLVRNEDDYYRCYHYILANPRFLPRGSFTIYTRDSSK